MTHVDSTRPVNRRRLLLAAAAAFVGASASASIAAERRALTVYKTPYCTCCEGWIAHMAKAGFTPEVVRVEDLNPIRRRLGVPFALSACHTGVTGGYVVEGHVPSADVLRLLKERPKALGLTVPGMPFGAPGMETSGVARETFDTLMLLDAKGRTRVFAHHG
jgi:hypothetical protein